jgi:hypothetical protein
VRVVACVQAHKQELLQLQLAHNDELQALKNRHETRISTLQRELALSREQHAAELKVSTTTESAISCFMP